MIFYSSGLTVPAMFTGFLFPQKYLHAYELFEPIYIRMHYVGIYNDKLTRVKNRRIFIRTR